MRVYVACHCRWAASRVASVLQFHGHTITSSWHDKEFLSHDEMQPRDRAAAAAWDFMAIRNSDCVCLVSGLDKYPGGKFIEAGFALGIGLPVFVIGRLENVMLYSPMVFGPFKSPEVVAHEITKAFLPRKSNG
jgi:hypothetical protein